MTCVLIIFGPIAANLALLTLWASHRRHQTPAPSRPVRWTVAPPAAVPAIHRPAPTPTVIPPGPTIRRPARPELIPSPIGARPVTVPPFATHPTIPTPPPAAGPDTARPKEARA